LTQTALLKEWSQEIPPGLRAAAQRGADTAATQFDTVTGERHGSWFLELHWRDELVRSALLALTNPSAVPDAATTRVVITARAAAASESRFVTETVFEQRRAISRVSSSDLENWLVAAVQRAQGYTLQSLAQAYATGLAGV
jgi:hypothetical protein